MFYNKVATAPARRLRCIWPPSSPPLGNPGPRIVFCIPPLPTRTDKRPGPGCFMTTFHHNPGSGRTVRAALDRHGRLLKITCSTKFMLIIAGFGLNYKNPGTAGPGCPLFWALNAHLHLLRSQPGLPTTGRQTWGMRYFQISGGTQPKLSSVNPVSFDLRHDHFWRQRQTWTTRRFGGRTADGPRSSGLPQGFSGDSGVGSRRKPGRKSGRIFLLPVRNGSPLVLTTR